MTDSTEKLLRYNRLYMDLAGRIAEMSHAVRLKVGCLLVKDGNIISFGWNGMPAGWDNGCEDREFMPFDGGGMLDPTEIWHQWPFEGKFWIDGNVVDARYRLVTKPEVLHSEANCLMKLAKTNGSALGSTMFCTHAPCMGCAKLIYGAGVTKLLYRDTYRDNSGLEFLDRSGVAIEHFGG